MTFKTIFSGRLEFGSARSFEQVQKMFLHRLENFYKNEIVLKQEDIFNEEEYALDIPRLVTQSTEKNWRNTINLLEYLAQYAIAGSLSAWTTDNGKVLKHRVIEPKSDKAAVQSFLRGREFIKEQGKESEARKALSRAIEKFERHALAYERRGYVNYILRNYEDAVYDFSKSIDINPNNGDPYLGRALVHIAQDKVREALPDLEKAIKQSIPLQPNYWKARRIKGECHLQLEEYEQAIFELKLFTRRQFASDNPNYAMRKRAFSHYGQALLAKGNYDDAIKAFDQAIDLQGDRDDNPDIEPYLFRGIALQKSGQRGFEKDWKEAADRGSQRAVELLEAIR